jgi:protein-L-isoaspartate(D-aspartate) O-methyltransferase
MIPIDPPVDRPVAVEVWLALLRIRWQNRERTAPMRIRGGRSLALGGCLLVAACTAESTAGQGAKDWEARRTRMIDSQLRARGIADARVLDAMRKVPRHLFVPEEYRARAYDDSPLPIGHDQTISQPYIVGYMSEALELRPTDRVLEIGTGSGYQAAILGELAGEVYTIEIVPELAERARVVLRDAGYRNVHVRHGNGYLGWPEAAPFDRVIVTAAPEKIPQALVDQLAVGGIMVVPVGGVYDDQVMTILRKTDQGVITRETLPVRFVPMRREIK